jgi:hypothetical protein
MFISEAEWVAFTVIIRGSFGDDYITSIMGMLRGVYSQYNGQERRRRGLKPPIIQLAAQRYTTEL